MGTKVKKEGSVTRIWTAYLFVIPALTIYLLFGLYPFLKTLQYSFFKWDGISPQMTFVGIANYKDIILSNKVWWQSFANAGVVSGIALFFQNSFALLLALFIYKGIKKGHIIYRVLFFLPPMLSLIVVGYIWLWIYDGNYGILNHFLKIIGLENLARAWLARPSSALLSVAVVHCWWGFGYAFMLFLAGLQSIPEQLYEAARVDGANEWKQLIHITLPLLVPVATIISVLTILGTMQIFALIMAMTQGGPGYYTEVPITRIFKQAFTHYHFGYATAMALIFGIILLILSAIQIEISRRKLHYY